MTPGEISISGWLWKLFDWATQTHGYLIIHRPALPCPGIPEKKIQIPSNQKWKRKYIHFTSHCCLTCISLQTSRETHQRTSSRQVWWIGNYLTGRSDDSQTNPLAIKILSKSGHPNPRIPGNRTQ